MAKGYSDEESKNRMQQMQDCREVEKIRGLDSPHPPEAVAAAATALLTFSAAPNATRVTLATITPDALFAAMGKGSLIGVLFPSLMRKT